MLLSVLAAPLLLAWSATPAHPPCRDTLCHRPAAPARSFGGARLGAAPAGGGMDGSSRKADGIEAFISEMNAEHGEELRRNAYWEVMLAMSYRTPRFGEHARDVCATYAQTAREWERVVARLEDGEAGLRLSSGQRARVAFARAVYSDADALILDDVFAAVTRTRALCCGRRSSCSCSCAARPSSSRRIKCSCSRAPR